MEHIVVEKEYSEEELEIFVDMGFTSSKARKALKETVCYTKTLI